MRTSIAVLLCLAMLVPGPARAQSLTVGALGMRGNGPVSSQAMGLELALNLPLGVAVVGEASNWSRVSGSVCKSSIPDGYACHADGWAALAGLRLSVPLLLASLDPYIQGQRGWFAPTPIPPREGRPSASALEVGIRLGLGPLSAGVGARRVWVDDHEYEKAFDEHHRYTMLVARLAFGL